jgi:hypothetical protein
MGFFTKRVTIEKAVEMFVRTIPRCIQFVHEESGGGRSAVPDAMIANISAGMFLFFLAGLLPHSEEANTQKMLRAFQAMWSFVGHAGGDADGAREWFQEFNAGLEYSESPPDRIAITTHTVRARLFSSPDAECPFDILPYTISAGVDSVKKYQLT